MKISLFHLVPLLLPAASSFPLPLSAGELAELRELAQDVRPASSKPYTLGEEQREFQKLMEEAKGEGLEVFGDDCGQKFNCGKSEMQP